MQPIASVTTPAKVRRIVRLGAARAADIAAAQAAPPLQRDPARRSENNGLENNGLSARTRISVAPLALQRDPRRTHRLAAAPPLPRLERKHLASLIVMMVVLWAGLMAFGIHKGLTPRNGMVITEDK